MAYHNSVRISGYALASFITNIVEVSRDPDGYGLSESEARDYRMARDCLDGQRLRRPSRTQDVHALLAILTDLSNSEDWTANCAATPPECKRHSLAASQGLATIAVKASRLWLT